MLTIAYPEFIVKIDNVLGRYGISLYTVLLFVAIAVLVEYFIRQIERELGYSHKETNRFLILLGVALVITYVFAAVFDGLFHVLEGETFDEGGLTFISGFIGGVIAFSLLVFFLLKEERKNLLSIFNAIIPGVVLAHAIGRIGCFTAGCCHGLPTDSPFGVIFPNTYASTFLYGEVPVHPTQLYEAFFLIALFFALRFLPKIKEHKFASYLIGYGLFRFILEMFFRGDDRGSILGIPPSLLLSILMAAFGIGILLWKYFRLKVRSERTAE